ncbi:hypothetical protein [Enterococcus faecalis]
MEQTKVEPVIECFVSHGPINQLSFFYAMYYMKKSEPSVKMTDGSLSKS